jgi:hypothetical protein
MNVKKYNFIVKNLEKCNMPYLPFTPENGFHHPESYE